MRAAWSIWAAGLIGLLVAGPAAAQVEDVEEPGPAWGPFEPPIVGGYCSQRQREECFSLQVADALRLDAFTLGAGVSHVLLQDEGLFLSDSDFVEGSTVTAAVGSDLVYAVVRVAITSDAPHAVLADLPWMGDGPLTAAFNLELYRLDRPATAAWLAAATERARLEQRRGCPPDEVPYPVHALARDLDGDGQPEGLTTLAATPAPDWFCRWTDVHTVGASPASLGLVPHGWPSVTVVDLPSPAGGTVPLVSSHFECCDLDQTFVVNRVQGGRLVELFNNASVTIGEETVAGYGMWHRTALGEPVIAFTRDLEAYNYGQPQSLDAFVLLYFDGVGFRERPQPPQWPVQPATPVVPPPIPPQLPVSPTPPPVPPTPPPVPPVGPKAG